MICYMATSVLQFARIFFSRELFLGQPEVAWSNSEQKLPPAAAFNSPFRCLTPAARCVGQWIIFLLGILPHGTYRFLNIFVLTLN